MTQYPRNRLFMAVMRQGLRAIGALVASFCLEG